MGEKKVKNEQVYRYAAKVCLVAVMVVAVLIVLFAVLNGHYSKLADKNINQTSTIEELEKAMSSQEYSRASMFSTLIIICTVVALVLLIVGVWLWTKGRPKKMPTETLGP